MKYNNNNTNHENDRATVKKTKRYNSFVHSSGFILLIAIASVFLRVQYEEILLDLDEFCK